MVEETNKVDMQKEQETRRLDHLKETNLELRILQKKIQLAEVNKERHQQV
jgi:hypothetical protein